MNKSDHGYSQNDGGSQTNFPPTHFFLFGGWSDGQRSNSDVATLWFNCLQWSGSDWLWDYLVVCKGLFLSLYGWNHRLYLNMDNTSPLPCVGQTDTIFLGVRAAPSCKIRARACAAWCKSALLSVSLYRGLNTSHNEIQIVMAGQQKGKLL